MESRTMQDIPMTRTTLPGQVAPDAAVYVISVAAELAGMHAQTLRSYERHGLIDPARTQGGDRRYSQNDLFRLNRINELSGNGVSVAAIKQIIDLQDENLRLREELRTVQALLDEQAGESDAAT